MHHQFLPPGSGHESVSTELFCNTFKIQSITNSLKNGFLLPGHTDLWVRDLVTTEKTNVLRIFERKVVGKIYGPIK